MPAHSPGNENTVTREHRGRREIAPLVSGIQACNTDASLASKTRDVKLILAVHLLVALLATGLMLPTNTAVAASNCKLGKIADLPVRPGGGAPVVDGAVNGQMIGVMLDTGGGTMILRSAADRLGLTRQQVTGARVFGVGGETHVEEALVDEFRVGQITRKNLQMIVVGERDFGNRIDAILGEDFFNKIDVEFDLPHNAVRLFQAKDCDRVSLAYWATQGAGEIEMATFLNAGAWIVLTVQINGQPMQAELDSGSYASVLDKSTAERLGITPDSPGVVPGGKAGGLGSKSVDSWIAPLRSFTIGDETIRDTTIRFADLWKDATYTSTGSHLHRKLGDAPPMLLGADFLRAHRVLVAHSQRKVYFTYEGGPVFQPKGTPETRPVPAPDRGSKAGAEAN
jgi:predicted aspartyl protease